MLVQPCAFNLYSLISYRIINIDFGDVYRGSMGTGFKLGNKPGFPAFCKAANYLSN